MSSSIPATQANGSGVVEAVRSVCERVDEPTEIWEALESNGIDATPGIVHQAINEPKEPECPLPEKGLTSKPHADPAGGLTAGDIKLLAELVDKAGGVAALTTVLKSIQRIAK